METRIFTRTYLALNLLLTKKVKWINERRDLIKQGLKESSLFRFKAGSQAIEEVE